MQSGVFRRLVDQADEPIIVADDGLKVLYLNEEARSSLGVEAVGSRLPDLIPGRYEEEAPRPGGGWRVVRLNGHWALFGEREPRAVEEDPWVRQLLQSEQLAALGQLSAVVVEEIGAPLTAIEMAADRLARRECETCRIQDEDREVILAQTHRIAQLSRLLTNLASPGAPHLRAVDVNEVVREVAEIVGRSLEEEEIRTTLTLQPELPQIASDPRRIQQVLVTLLSNARQAMVGGGELAVSTRLKGEWVELRVADSGPGIPAEDLSKIFLPFFSRSGGTGLGLPLARQLVHSLGGTVGVQTEEGKGATFVVLLPVSHGSPGKAEGSDG